MRWLTLSVTMLACLTAMAGADPSVHSSSHARVAARAATRTIALGPNVVATLLDASPTPGVPEGRVLVATQAMGALGAPQGVGQVRALDLATGRVLRTVSVGYGPDSLALDKATRRLFVANKISRTITVLNSRTLAAVRTVVVPPSPLQVTVDAASGQVVLTTGGATDSGGASLGSGGVAKLDPHDGRVLYVTPIAGIPWGVYLDARRGRLYLFGDGVNIVDAARGRLLRTLPLLGGAGFLLDDARRGRLFVLTVVQPTNPNLQRAVFSAVDLDAVKVLRATTSKGTAVGLASGDKGAVLLFRNDVSSQMVQVNDVDPISGRVSPVTHAFGQISYAGEASPVVDVRHDLVFLAAGVPSGNVVVDVRDARTGALLQAIPVLGSDVLRQIIFDHETSNLYIVSVDTGQRPPHSYLTIITRPSQRPHIP